MHLHRLNPLDAVFTLAMFCAVLSVFLGVSVAVGWLMHIPALVQMQPQYAPMQFNAAICFVLYGLALAALCLHQNRAATLLCVLPVALNGLTLAEYIFSLNLGIDQLFITPDIMTHVVHAGRIAPNAAIAFLLVGCTLIAHARICASHSGIYVLSILSQLVFIIGLVAVIGYASGVEPGFGWAAFNQMALGAALGFCMLGGGMMLYGRFTRLLLPVETARYHLPSLVPCIVLCVTFYFWLALDAREIRHSKTVLQQDLRYLQSDIQEHLDSRILSLKRMAERWELNNGTPYAMWQKDASNYVRDQQEYRAIEWVDSTYHIRWIEPVKGNEAAQGLDLFFEPNRAATLKRAAQTHHAVVSPPVELVQGGKGLLVYMPVTAHGAFDGFIVGAFGIDNLMKAVLSDAFVKDAYLTISSEGKPLYSDGVSPPPDAHHWHIDRTLDLYGTQWNISAQPRPEFLVAQRSAIPEVVLAAGILLSFLLNTVVHYAYAARKQASDFAKLNRLNQAMLASTKLLVIATDARGTVTSFNREAERALGYQAQEIIGKQTPALWHDPAETVARARELSEQYGRTIEPGFAAYTFKAVVEGSESREWTFIRKNGLPFPASLTVTPMLDDTGGVTGFVGVIEDITERKAEQDALKASEETFRLALEHASIGMALVSPSGRWIQVNAALCELIGYSREELLRTDFQSVTHPDDLQADLNYVRQLLAGQLQTYEMEKRYFHKNGQVIWALLNVSLLRDPAGEPRYFISQIQDITVRKQAERMKSEFVSTVSHELRTPLTSIRGALGLIAAGATGTLPSKAEELAALAYKNSERLVRIINDILDLEKIESGRMQTQMRDIAVGELLHQVALDNRAYAEKYQVKLQVAPAISGLAMHADFDRMHQALTNLVANACKFSPAGAQVEIEARRLAGTGIAIAIRDHGEGIPKAFHPLVFEKFSQADASTTRKHEGTGLGLAITKKLVEAMGGSIGFVSEEGKGTTFTLTLPEAHGTPQAPAQRLVSGVPITRPERSVEALPYLPKVLHVEDDGDLINVIATALQGKAELVGVTTLSQAEERLKQHRFALMVLDLELPDGNGLTLLNRVHEITGHAMPVVILSASEAPNDLRGKVDAMLVKSRMSEARIVETIMSIVHHPSS